MKILHVITSLQTGGAEKLLVDLLPRLADEGIDVELAVFNAIETPFMRSLIEDGIKIHRFYEKGCNVYNPGNLLKLIALIRKGNYDIVHTHNTSPQIFGALSSLFTKAQFVTTEHNTSNRRRAWKWYIPADRWMYSRYRKVISISLKAEENLRNYLGISNLDMSIINNGIDIIQYSTASPSEELEKLVPRSRKIIMVAAFRWEKDQLTLIKSLKFLPDHFHIFLVGEGPLKRQIEDIVAKERLIDRVHFLGLRSDVPSLLHAADYIVMSSHFEGLSLSSVEGMSVGKPFLASNVDGLKEVVEGAGVLFPHEDPKTLADEILKLENSPDLYNSLISACCKRACQFDISKTVKGYIQAYNKLND